MEMTTISCQGARIGNDISIGTNITNVAVGSGISGGLIERLVVDFAVTAEMTPVPINPAARQGEAQYYVNLTFEPEVMNAALYDPPIEGIIINKAATVLSSILQGEWELSIESQTLTREEETTLTEIFQAFNDERGQGVEIPEGNRTELFLGLYNVKCVASMCRSGLGSECVVQCGAIDACQGGTTGDCNVCEGLNYTYEYVNSGYIGPLGNSFVGNFSTSATGATGYPLTLQINNNVTTEVVVKSEVIFVKSMDFTIQNLGDIVTAYQMDLTQIAGDCRSVSLSDPKFEIVDSSPSGGTLRLRTGVVLLPEEINTFTVNVGMTSCEKRDAEACQPPEIMPYKYYATTDDKVGIPGQFTVVRCATVTNQALPADEQSTRAGDDVEDESGE